MDPQCGDRQSRSWTGFIPRGWGATFPADDSRPSSETAKALSSICFSIAAHHVAAAQVLQPGRRGPGADVLLDAGPESAGAAA